MLLEDLHAWLWPVDTTTEPVLCNKRSDHNEKLNQSFEELIPFFIFQGLFLYTEMLYKSHAGINVRCFIQMYTEVLGVLPHLLARGAC